MDTGNTFSPSGPFRSVSVVVALCSSLVTFQNAKGQLAVLDQFNPNPIGDIVGLAFDNTTDQVWVYGSFNDFIFGFSRIGEQIDTIVRPGESANDTDLEIAPETFTLGSLQIESGTLLMINGETDTATIFAIDPSTGNTLGGRATSFGMSHVVGGAYHAGRNTFFLLQDRQPAGAENKNIVAEINPVDGSVINTFKIDTVLPGYTVNYGDIEVNNLSGNLLIVSSDESSIAEFTPTGGFVQTLALPVGVSGLSGIALDEARGEAWVSSSSGIVYRLGNFPADIFGKFSIRLSGISEVELSWPSDVDVVYEIEYRANFGESEWGSLASDIIGDGKTLKYQDTVQIGQQRFYRLVHP